MEDDDMVTGTDEIMIADNNAFLMAMGAGSRIEVHGADAEKESWTQLETTAEAGSNTLQVQEDTGWQVGDKIAIASTSDDWEEAEEFMILEISGDGTMITLDSDLQHSHSGYTEQYDNGQDGEDHRTWNVELRAEVALLSRNVTIQGDEDSVEDGFGGHTMVMDGAEQHISGAEFYRMGQEDILGRYPIHWHMLGDAEGQYVENVSVHESYQKGSTIHGTSNVRYEDNVIYDHVGHGVFFEDGSENGNQIIGNLVFSTKESETGEPIPTDAEHASSFWIENPNNVFIGNHAAGSESNGFWIFEGQLHGLSAETYVGDAGQLHDLIFIDNVGHTSSGDGGAGGTDKILGIDGRIDGDLDFVQSTLAAEFGVIEGFTAYSGNVWSLTHEMVFTESAFVDVRFFTRHENVIEDSVFDSTTIILYRDGGNQYSDVLFTGGARIIPISSDHVNTPQVFNNVVDQGSTVINNGALFNQQILLDVDGTYTGIAGAFITPGGANGAFNANPGAGSFDNGFVSEYTIGATEVTALDTDGAFRVLRSDGESVESVADSIDRRNVGDDPEDRSDANYEFYTTSGMDRDLAYLLDFEDMPEELTLSLANVREGESVVYEIPGIAGSYQVTDDSAQVSSFDALLASDTTAYYRGTDSVFVRLVAGESIVEEGRPVNDALADFYANASIAMTISGFSGSTGALSEDLLTAIADAPLREVADDPTAYELEEPTEEFALDRYQSTSDTTVVTADMARWSDASTWGDARVPGANDIVVVGPGETVVLDQTMLVKGIIVNGGELIIEDGNDLVIDLATDYLLVTNGGLFQAGTEDDPLDTEFTLTLEGDDPDFDLYVSEILAGNVENTVFADTGEEVVTMAPEAVEAPENEPAPETLPELEPTDPQNLILNGDFEDHAVLTRGAGQWDVFVFEEVTGWTATTGQIEVQDGVQGTVGNSVVELDASDNAVIEQVVTVAQSGVYRFSLDYAARNGTTDNGSSDFEIFINDEVYAVVENDSTSMETLEFEANLEMGEATVRIAAAGVSDGLGALIDNVGLKFIGSTVTPQPQELRSAEPALSVYLADTDTDETLAEITGGSSIALGDVLGRSLTIYAEAADGTNVESVALFMDDTLTAIENVSPYALFGDNGGDFGDGMELAVGNYDFRIDAYSEDQANGQLLDQLEMSLTITQDDSMANILLLA